MKEFKQAMKERFHQRKLTGQSIGAFILYHLQQRATYPDSLTGYIRHGQFFVKLDVREDKTTRFHKRQQYTDEINKKLAGHDYEFQLLGIKVK